MKDLQLGRSIPLSAVGALVIAGCGGRTLGLVEQDGSDPYSDESFDDTLLESLEDYCEKQALCGYGYSAPQCAEYYAETFSEQFDLDTRHCRKLAIETIDCVAERRGCDSPSRACGRDVREFTRDCADYDYYYVYDY